MRPLTYLFIIFIIFTVGAIWVLSFGNLTECNLSLFKLNKKILSTFFKYASLWAEWPIILTSLLLSFYKWGKYAWMWVLSFAIEGVIIQTIKRFYNAPRPIESFPTYAKQVDGILLAHYGSFPSGHTAAVVFGTGLLLWSLYSTHSKSRVFLSIVLFLGVISAALSRVYLCQHHLQDIFAGGLIGATIFYLFSRINTKLFPILSK